MPQGQRLTGRTRPALNGDASHRRTLVIGGGLGEAIAAASPGQVVLASRTRPRHADNATHLEFDPVATPDITERVIDAAIEQLGGLDVVVTCAGARLHRGRLLDHTEADWINAYRANVLSTLRVCRHVVPVLAQSQQAVLVIVITAHDPLPNPQVAPYSAAEAALDVLTRTLAVDLSTQGIRVFAVAPAAPKPNQPLRRPAPREPARRRHPETIAATLSVVGGEEARLPIREGSARIPVVYFGHLEKSAQHVLELIEDPAAEVATYLIDADW
jgi:NAD(P)-dependent dehydrogenase (short-subunit alcohol dehydrogenase family)